VGNRSRLRQCLDRVAGRTTVATWPAATLEANLLTVGDPGRATRLHLAGAMLDGDTSAGGARVVDDDAGATAAAARRAEAEECGFDSRHPFQDEVPWSIHV
jgi:hypothetical protein